MDDRQAQNDHDLIIELRSMMRTVISSLEELKSDLLPRVTRLETDKLGKEENAALDAATSARVHTKLEDHETRIRRNEWQRIFLWGAITVISGVLALISHMVKIY